MRAPAVHDSRDWRPLAWRMGPYSQLLLVAAAGLAVFVFTFSGFGALMGAAALAATVLLAVWSWPLAGAVALVALAPIHQFLMLLVFHFTGSVTLLKAAQLWKEAILIILLAKVIDMAFRRRSWPRLHLLDLFVLMFFGWGAVYLAYPSSVEETTLFSKAMGLRADALFLLAYFIGRGMVVSRRNLRVLLVTFAAGVVVTAIVATLQFAAPSTTNNFFERLSFSEFFEVQRGDAAVSYAIRQNQVSGVLIPRASGLVLSDLGLAFYMLLAAPLMGALYFTLPGTRSKLLFNVIFLAAIGTSLLTVTRSAIVALVPSLLLITLLSRSILPGLVAAVQGLIVLAPTAYILGVSLGLLQSIFSPSEASAAGHITALEESMRTLQREPFGRGLGTAGQVAQRFTPESGITNESWYFQIGTEMGVAALLMFAAILIIFAGSALLRHRRVSDPWLKALSLGMGGAAIGFGIVGITLHAWENMTTSIVFWLLAGIALSIPDPAAENEGSDDAHRDMA